MLLKDKLLGFPRNREAALAILIGLLKFCHCSLGPIARGMALGWIEVWKASRQLVEQLFESERSGTAEQNAALGALLSVFFGLVLVTLIESNL